jgi:hypothetical protein
MSRRLKVGSKCGTEFMLASLEVVGVVVTAQSSITFEVPALLRHSRADGKPEFASCHWVPACAGMTRSASKIP